MYEELEEEFLNFKQDVDSGSLVFGRYFDEDDYEDEYSHNQIDEYKEKFIDKVIAYLHETNPGKYVVTSGWCVFIMTIDEAKKRKICSLEDLVVN